MFDANIHTHWRAPLAQNSMKTPPSSARWPVTIHSLRSVGEMVGDVLHSKRGTHDWVVCQLGEHTPHTTLLQLWSPNQKQQRSLRAPPQPRAAIPLTDFAPIDKALPARLRRPASEDVDPLACSFDGAEAPWGRRNPRAPLLAVTGPATETKASAGRQTNSRAPRSAMFRLSMVLATLRDFIEKTSSPLAACGEVVALRPPSLPIFFLCFYETPIFFCVWPAIRFLLPHELGSFLALFWGNPGARGRVTS